MEDGHKAIVASLSSFGIAELVRRVIWTRPSEASNVTCAPRTFPLVGNRSTGQPGRLTPLRLLIARALTTEGDQVLCGSYAEGFKTHIYI